MAGQKRLDRAGGMGRERSRVVGADGRTARLTERVGLLLVVAAAALALHHSDTHTTHTHRLPAEHDTPPPVCVRARARVQPSLAPRSAR